MAYVTKQWSYLLSGVVLGALMGQLIMGPGTTCQLSNDAEKETERIVHHSPCPTPNPCPTTPCQSVLDRMGPRLPNSVGNPETRDSWIARKAAEVPRGSKVLDVSAGAKPYKHLFSHCQYYSHEFSGNSQIVDGFRGESSVSLKQHDYGGDVTATTAPSNEFDVVLLTEVLEHVPEPLLAIQELARVAKPGARIFVTSPFTSGSHQQPYHFSSGYSREWYNYAASRYKLRVVSIETQGDFFKLLAQETTRGFNCAGLLPGADGNSVGQINTAIHAYFLSMSKHLESFSNPPQCLHQFEIGYMVHFEKLAD